MTLMAWTVMVNEDKSLPLPVRLLQCHAYWRPIMENTSIPTTVENTAALHERIVKLLSSGTHSCVRVAHSAEGAAPFGAATLMLHLLLAHGTFTALVIRFVFRPRGTIRVPEGSREPHRSGPGTIP